MLKTFPQNMIVLDNGKMGCSPCTAYILSHDWSCISQRMKLLRKWPHTYSATIGSEIPPCAMTPASCKARNRNASSHLCTARVSCLGNATGETHTPLLTRSLVSHFLLNVHTSERHSSQPRLTATASVVTSISLLCRSNDNSLATMNVRQDESVSGRHQAPH